MQRGVFRILIFLFLKLFLVTDISAQCIVVTDIVTYHEDFETTNGNWISGGTSSDWAWGSPMKPTINTAGSGKKCWITGGLTGSFYNSKERSYINSPCFDFTNLTNPFIRFKVYWETEYQYDGAAFQYSLDNGASWQNVGAANETTNCLNANWFNYSSVINLTGLGSGQQGWSGTIQPPNPPCGGGNGSGGWLTASHEMSNLAGKANVLFRFTFGAGSICNNFDGFAIDDITISNAPPYNNVSFITNCITNLEVGFSNTSSPCFNSYVWSFGDPVSGANNSSSSLNPTHIFSSPGSYTISLSATGATGPPVL